MSTVKQTQAIPYTGPFNLLYYQLQKLTGVFTEIHIIAFLVRTFFKKNVLRYNNCLRIPVHCMVILLHKSQHFKNYSQTLKNPTVSLITYNLKNISSLFSLYLKSVLVTYI